MRHRLVLASNRGPVGFRIGDRGSLVARRGGGGLVTALGGLAKHHDVTWIAHAMTDGDVEASKRADGGTFPEVSRGGAEYQLGLVGTPDTTYQRYYNTFANPLLWFLMHRLYGFGWDPTINRNTHAAYRAYRTVNQRIADALVRELANDDEDDADTTVMVHDYHLFLVPKMVRDERPDAFIEFFLHIPWPAAGSWTCMPREWVRSFVESLLACDIVGVQTDADALDFVNMCDVYLGADVDYEAHTVQWEGRTVHVRAYPISVAVDEFAEHAKSPTVARLQRTINGMRAGGEEGSLIVRVDRTDPSKNIVRGFRAYALMLREHPELHGRVVMFCQLDPSRQDVPEYVKYLGEIQATASEVNVQFGTGSWQPLFVNLDANFQAAVAAYTQYDVLFVNPVVDGMNLVSKEGPLVNERNGAVVLSEQAGSYVELGPWVTGVNPFDIADQADKLYEALTMSVEQRTARAEAIRAHVTTHDVAHWIDTQLADIAELRARRTA